MTLTRAYRAGSAWNDLGVLSSPQGSSETLTDVNIGPVKVRTIRDLRELETLRPIWKSWPGTMDSDLDFFSSVVRSRGCGCQPHVIVLGRDARPDAILVGMRERQKIPVKLGHITVCQPEVNVLEFVHGGLRGAASAENCAALLQQVMRSLGQGEADLASWKQLYAHSSLYSCVLQLKPYALRDHFPCDDDQWVMNFPKGLDAFLSGLCRSQRSKLRRKHKKVLNYFQSGLQVRQFRSVVDLDLAIPAMEEIAKKSDKRQFGWGFFDTPQIREHMSIAAKLGWLRIYVLYLQDKAAAFWMGTLYDRCLKADQVGYDPTWSEFSPGIFLFLNILEDLRDADIEIVDFGSGSSQLKTCFGAFQQAESQVHIYASTLRGVQMSLLYAATHRASFVIRRTQSLERATASLWHQLSRKHHKIKANCADGSRARVAN